MFRSASVATSLPAFRRRALALLVLAACSAHATGRIDSAETVQVWGIVVDESGRPVEGATVAAVRRRDREIETVTNAAGEFKLTAPWEQLRGRCVLASVQDGARLGFSNLGYGPTAPELDSLRIELQPALPLEIFVTDSAGRPLAGVTCGAVAGSFPARTEKSNESGLATITLPASVRVEVVFAFRSGDGLDYRAFTTRPKPDEQPMVFIPEGPVRLTLDGVHPVRVRLSDPSGAPISSVPVYPWLLRKPGEMNEFNLSYASELFTVTTDARGEAAFDFIPRWCEQSIAFWPSTPDYARTRIVYDAKTGAGDATGVLERFVPIRGRVTQADGSPAPDINVIARGEGHALDSFHGSAMTDAEGRFEIQAAPNMVYLVTAAGKNLASAPRTGFAVWPGQPVDGLDFVMRPATRIFGRVTVGDSNAPVEGQAIHVYQYGTDAHNSPELELPNPEGSRRWVQPSQFFVTQTGADGRFQLLVGDGSFDIRGPTQNRIEKFTIAGELEKEFLFHAERPESGILRGRIVTGEPPKPVPNVEIEGIYRHPLAPDDLRTTADSRGEFEVERSRHRTVLHAWTNDGSLAGVVEIGPDDVDVAIHVAPLASANARLVDSATGAPSPGEEIIYGVRVPAGDDNAPFRTAFGGKTTTDAEGRFRLTGLILGQKYNVRVTIRTGSGVDDVAWRAVGSVTPDRATLIDLGDLYLREANKAPTINDRIADAFDLRGTRGTPLERFDVGRRDVSLSRQHLLIVFGDPQTDSVQQLMTLRYEDAKVRRALDSYRVLAISTAPDQLPAARTLARAISDELPVASGRNEFCVTVVDHDGKIVAVTDAEGLSKSNHIDRDFVRAFLAEHALPPLDGRKLLDDALARAKAENKRVIVQETATWCSPCWALSRFLDAQRAVWERDYLWIKMDQRWTHAHEIMREFRAGADGGIPWWAILDADGKVLVTSNRPDGDNIGFPGESDDGIAHFQRMFEQTAIRMTEENIAELVQALKASH